MPDGAVVALDVGVLLRLTGLDVLDRDAQLLSPDQEPATPFDDPVQTVDDPFGWQREVDLDTQSLAVEVIQHVQQPKCTAIFEAICHEVHGLGHVGCIGHGQRIGFVALQPLARLDPQVQLQLAVDPIDAFVVPRMALHVTRMQKTKAKTPSLASVRQPDQKIGDLLVLGPQLRAITIAGFSDPEGPTGEGNARPSSRHRVLGHLAALRWPSY
jgi:hypothetical protein